MYLFEKCPFQIDPSTDECLCFDSGFLASFKRPPDIIHHYCRGDFRGCPYYLTHGVPSRIPEEAKPKTLYNTSGEPDSVRGNTVSLKERRA